MIDQTGKICPYCQSPIKPDSHPVVCTSCGIPHHRQCWEENGGCTSFGCEQGRLDGRGMQAQHFPPVHAESQPTRTPVGSGDQTASRNRSMTPVIAFVCFVLILAVGLCLYGASSLRRAPVHSSDIPEKTIVQSSPALTETEVIDLVNRWVSSQNDRDFAKYRSLYAPDFTGVKRTRDGSAHRYDYATWMADRSKMIERTKSLQVSVAETDVTLDEAAGSALVEFTQYFRTSRYGDKGPKKLRLRLTDAGVRIVHEEMLWSEKL